MSPDKRVLVVGTTTDYIQWIRESRPGEAVFVTDPLFRRDAREPHPGPSEEILCPLDFPETVQKAVEAHLAAHRLQLCGIASFDCESMELAATLAARFGLSYPSVNAVRNCRNKYASRWLWQRHGLDTPVARQVGSAREAVDFWVDRKSPCVFKPLDGSGSELIFLCRDAFECTEAFHRISGGLQMRRDHRLYRSACADQPVILAETAVFGNEYSADFIIEETGVRLIRTTRKIIDSTVCFGTALAYLLMNSLPDEIDEAYLKDTLFRAARALGITRAVCMVDFIVHEGGIFLLEMTPRPGGDCLPFLTRHALDLDILGLFLDFARGDVLLPEQPVPEKDAAGLRLRAHAPGILRHVDARRLENDSRVREIHVNRRPGHRIVMPPADYDSWILGHVVFEPLADRNPEMQCRELAQQVIVEVQ